MATSETPILPPSEPVPIQVKNGFKTSEFWLTLLVVGATLLESARAILPPEWAAIATALAAGLYAVSRALTKGAAIQASVPPVSGAS